MNTNTLPAPAFDAALLQSAPAADKRQVLLQWSAPSHHNHIRSLRWYVSGGILVMLIAAYGVLSGAWTLTIVALLLGGVYFLVRREKTPLKAVRIEQDGVQYEEIFLPWTQCKDFWLITTPAYTELHVARSGRLRSEISVQIGDIDPTTLRSTLSRFLPMRGDQRERMLDFIIRICKL